MVPVIMIVGHSDSGKTTLLEKLIPELKKRGYRIGTVKHASHGFSMDQKGKDTYRHRAAGADTVIAASPEEISIVKSTASDNLDSLLMYLQDMDLVLVEGYKKEKKPKIEVFRSEIGQKSLLLEDENLIAIVTDHHFSGRIPVFQLDDVTGLANIIEKHCKELMIN